MPHSRAEAEALLFEFTRSDALRKHGRAVEEAMRAYAGWHGIAEPGEVEKWGIVGLLHDFDYEQNPTEDTHLHVGGRILRERGWPEEIVEAICSHADYMGIPRDTPLKKSLYACDELVGFIGACVKVRPTKKVADLPVKSVTKKLDVLVVADPDTMSSKAKKARTYGVRIMAEPVFWRLMGIDVE